MIQIVIRATIEAVILPKASQNLLVSLVYPVLWNEDCSSV